MTISTRSSRYDKRDYIATVVLLYGFGCEAAFAGISFYPPTTQTILRFVVIKLLCIAVCGALLLRVIKRSKWRYSDAMSPGVCLATLLVVMYQLFTIFGFASLVVKSEWPKRMPIKGAIWYENDVNRLVLTAVSRPLIEF